MSAQIGRTQLATHIPISASIALTKLPIVNPEMLDLILTKLFDAKLFANSVGITADRLMLSAHIGSAEAMSDLKVMGFEVYAQGAYHRVPLYTLSRQQNTTQVNKDIIKGALMQVYDMAPLAALTFKRRSVFKDSAFFAQLTNRMSCWANPSAANGSFVSIVSYTGFDHLSAAQLTFDDMALHAMNRIIATGQAKTHDDLAAIVRDEMELWATTVEGLFPIAGPAFRVWATTYGNHLITTWFSIHESYANTAISQQDKTAQSEKENAVSTAERFINPNPSTPVKDVLGGVVTATRLQGPRDQQISVADKIFAEGANAEAEGRADTSVLLEAAAADPGAIHHPAESIHDVMSRRETAAVFGIPEKVGTGMPLKVRAKPSIAMDAWQVPALTNHPAFMIPSWVALKLLDMRPEGTSQTKWEMMTGHWFVKSPHAVSILTPEQFALMYDVQQDAVKS